MLVEWELQWNAKAGTQDIKSKYSYTDHCYLISRVHLPFYLLPTLYTDSKLSRAGYHKVPFYDWAYKANSNQIITIDSLFTPHV